MNWDIGIQRRRLAVVEENEERKKTSNVYKAIFNCCIFSDSSNFNFHTNSTQKKIDLILSSSEAFDIYFC